MGGISSTTKPAAGEMAVTPRFTTDTVPAVTPTPQEKEPAGFHH